MGFLTASGPAWACETRSAPQPRPGTTGFDYPIGQSFAQTVDIARIPSRVLFCFMESNGCPVGDVAVEDDSWSTEGQVARMLRPCGPGNRMR